MTAKQALTEAKAMLQELEQQVATFEEKLGEHALVVGVDRAATQRATLSVKLAVAKAEVEKLTPAAELEMEEAKKQRLEQLKAGWQKLIAETNGVSLMLTHYTERVSFLRQRFEGMCKQIAIQERQAELQEHLFLGPAFWNNQAPPPDFDLAEQVRQFEQEFAAKKDNR